MPPWFTKIYFYLQKNQFTSVSLAKNILLILIKEHIISDYQDRKRFINYVIDILNDNFQSNKSIKKAIVTGELQLNYKKVETGRFVNRGDVIQIYDNEVNAPKEYKLKLEIIYEDDFLAVINKPAGIIVSGNQFRTIVNALGFNITKSTNNDALKWSKPVHRLDFQTSGLLIIAKTSKALVELGRMFENKHIKKSYKAVVIGKLQKAGVIINDINGQKAKTEYHLEKSVKSIKNTYLSLVNLHPHTGRTHQLRIHLSELGFPILGDKLYGKSGAVLKNKGLFLSAVSIEFKHPITDKMLNLSIDTPSKFITRLNNEERMWERKNNDLK